MNDYENIGLVLEGGGLRGVYTAGVLDIFLDNNLMLPYVIGVSAGACQSFSYASKQRGRSLKVNADYINDPRYLSLRNLIRKGEIFGMDFMFDEIPKHLIPFDYEAFDNTLQNVVMGVTSCETGKAEYFSNKDRHDMLLVCRASSSLPLLSKPVKIYDKLYLDGGIADPIPIKKAQADGYKKNIVVLTRNKGYRKKMSKNSTRMMKVMYKKYPKLVEAYERRYQVYNDTLEYLDKLEKNGDVFIIRPVRPVNVSRMEKNRDKLINFYNEACEDTKSLWAELERWLEFSINSPN